MLFATNTSSGPLGSVAGGSELLPGSVVNVPAQGLSAEGVTVTAQPLKLAGAAPPLTTLSFHHCAPQNVTDELVTALVSPTTNIGLLSAGAAVVVAARNAAVATIAGSNLVCVHLM